MAAQGDYQIIRGLPLRPVVDPDDLTNDMWKGVCKRSGILRGWIMSEIEGPNNKTQWVVKRAPKPVLKLDDRARNFYNIHDEDTFISVQIVERGLETALAYKAFSENGANLAINAGFNGFTGGIGADINKKKSSETEAKTKLSSSKMHASYNIPRVSIDLRQVENFNISSELTEHLVKAAEKPALSPQLATDSSQLTTDNKKEYQDFCETFGELFCLRALLGGRLHCLQDISGKDTSVQNTIKNELKFALTANIMSPVGGLTAGGHHGRGSEVSSTAQKTSLNGGISIEAQGGNPLVCWTPPDWVLSVGSYFNWRVINQDDAYTLIDIMCQYQALLDKDQSSTALKGAKRLQQIRKAIENESQKKSTPPGIPNSQAQQGQQSQQSQQSQVYKKLHTKGR